MGWPWPPSPRGRWPAERTQNLVAAFVVILLGAWNDYVLALVITFSQSVTLPLYLQVHPSATVALVAIVPPAAIGLVSQRYLTRGLSFGAARGR
jgi:multiple sugar transport system permease protein